MNAWCWTGESYETCQSLPIADRGFRYGMAIFESLRVWRSVPLFLAEHLQRLRQSCADRGFEFDEQALAATERLFREAKLDGFARIYVTAGDGSVTAPANHCRVFVLMEQRDWPESKAYELGMPSESHRPLFGGIKTANYWANIDALQHAVRRGKNEALLFNEHAELVSACMANIFVVQGDVVRTPELACGARDGVVRAWVMQQVPVKEGSIFVEDVEAADEIFLTNCWLGIMPVASIEGRKLASRSYATRLAAAYEQKLASIAQENAAR